MPLPALVQKVEYIRFFIKFYTFIFPTVFMALTVKQKNCNCFIVNIVKISFVHFHNL